MATGRGELTTLEYALLGLLRDWPASGYDVKKTFEATPLRQFSSSPGVIYPALKRLQRRGLVAARLDRTTEARPRRVFSLTDRGRAALMDWLRRQVTEEEFVKDGGAPFLRLSYMQGLLTPDEVIAYLEGLGRVVRGYVAKLRAHVRDAEAPAMLHSRLSMEAGIRGYEATVEWVEYAIAEVRAQAEGR